MNTTCLYQCFWCDRTTLDEGQVRLHRETGRLICLDCLDVERRRLAGMMRCARINADGSRCRSVRNRSLPWITDPWDCGKHRSRKAGK